MKCTFAAVLSVESRFATAFEGSDANSAVSATARALRFNQRNAKINKPIIEIGERYEKYKTHVYGKIDLESLFGTCTCFSWYRRRRFCKADCISRAHLRDDDFLKLQCIFLIVHALYAYHIAT